MRLMAAFNARPTGFGYMRNDTAAEEALYDKRKAAGITRVYKMVDTCSAEFEAKTPYFYSTFEGGHSNESKRSDRKKIVVLGSGPNRIGQGIEFDYCCCHASFALREAAHDGIGHYRPHPKGFHSPGLFPVEIVQHENTGEIQVELGYARGRRAHAASGGRE